MDPLIVLFFLVFLLIIINFRKKRKVKAENDLISSFESSPRTQTPKAKKRDGSKKTAQEQQNDLDNYLMRLSNKGKAYAKVQQIKQQRLGVTHYVWRSSEDLDCCIECKKNNGKKFSWRRPPKTGHPGEGRCCQNNICRCYPEAIIK